MSPKMFISAKCSKPHFDPRLQCQGVEHTTALTVLSNYAWVATILGCFPRAQACKASLAKVLKGASKESQGEHWKLRLMNLHRSA